MTNKIDIDVWEDWGTFDDKRGGYLLHASDRFGAQMLKRLKESIEASPSDVLEVVAYDSQNVSLRLKAKD
jgi:hypothetical protein